MLWEQLADFVKPWVRALESCQTYSQVSERHNNIWINLWWSCRITRVHWRWLGWSHWRSTFDIWICIQTIRRRNYLEQQEAGNHHTIFNRSRIYGPMSSYEGSNVDQAIINRTRASSSKRFSQHILWQSRCNRIGQECCSPHANKAHQCAVSLYPRKSSREWNQKSFTVERMTWWWISSLRA